MGEQKESPSGCLVEVALGNLLLRIFMRPLIIVHSNALITIGQFVNYDFFAHSLISAKIKKTY